MVMGRGRGGDPERNATWRGALLIVGLGVALGLAYNALGLAGRPARGLSWIARPRSLANVESLAAGRAGLSETSGLPDSGRAGAGAPAGLAPPAASAAPAPAARASMSGSRERPAGGTESPPARDPAPGGSSTPAPAPTPAAPFIPDVPGPLQLELATAKQLYDARGALFVDARDPEEYADGHIPGAVNLSYNDALAEPERVTKLDPAGRPFVVYCSGGTCELSSNLAQVMVEAGKRRVLVFEGGMPEWQSAGYPVARGSTPEAEP